MTLPAIDHGPARTTVSAVDVWAWSAGHQRVGEVPDTAPQDHVPSMKIAADLRRQGWSRDDLVSALRDVPPWASQEGSDRQNVIVGMARLTPQGYRAAAPHLRVGTYGFYEAFGRGAPLEWVRVGAQAVRDLKSAKADKLTSLPRMLDIHSGRVWDEFEKVGLGGHESVLWLRLALRRVSVDATWKDTLHLAPAWRGFSDPGLWIAAGYSPAEARSLQDAAINDGQRADLRTRLAALAALVA